VILWQTAKQCFCSQNHLILMTTRQVQTKNGERVLSYKLRKLSNSDQWMIAKCFPRRGLKCDLITLLVGQTTNFNHILESQIIFIKDCYKSCKGVNIKCNDEAVGCKKQNKLICYIVIHFCKIVKIFSCSCKSLPMHIYVILFQI